MFSNSIQTAIPHPCSGDLIPHRRTDYPQDSGDSSHSSGSSVNSYDSSGSDLSPPVNPQTGPCYVDLVIALDLACMNDDEYRRRF